MSASWRARQDIEPHHDLRIDDRDEGGYLGIPRGHSGRGSYHQLGVHEIGGGTAGRAEVEISRHLERNILKRLGKNQGALAEPARFRRTTSHPEVVAHIDEQLPEARLIVECPGKTFGFAEIAENPLEFSERKECSSQAEAKINLRQ